VSAGRSGVALSLASTLALASCADPYYVSLGGNAADLAGDAGSPRPVCSVRSDPLIPGARCGDAPPEPDRCASSSPPLGVASECASRRLLTCPAPAASSSGSLDADALDALLQSLLRACREEPNGLRVRFEHGCATSFSLDVTDGDPGSLVLSCVSARLESERYACAEAVPCGVGQIFGVPTSAIDPGWL
jgi:hypothetical protein